MQAIKNIKYRPNLSDRIPITSTNIAAVKKLKTRNVLMNLILTLAKSKAWAVPFPKKKIEIAEITCINNPLPF